jgi:hypothetical protein
VRAGGGERGECGSDSEVVKCGECVPEEASNVSAVVVMMSTDRGGGDCVVVCGGVSSV